MYLEGREGNTRTGESSTIARKSRLRGSNVAWGQ